MLRVVDEQLRANTYLAETAVPGEVVVVDPGLDTAAILHMLEVESLRPAAIACTHGHFDHVGSAHELKQAYGAPVYLHRGDAKLIRSANFLLMACKIEQRIIVPAIDVLVEDGTEIDVAGDVLRFVHTPGHTPGSCLVCFRGSIFTGDTIYRDGVGKADFPGEDKQILRESILRVWDRLDDDAIARPGHGGSARLGELKARNVALREFLGLGQARAA
jgi:hydroxyacylglutathione hydrolase